MNAFSEKKESFFNRRYLTFPIMFSHNFSRYNLLNVPDYHYNMNNLKIIIISPFQTSWNGNRWDNFSSHKQFHLLTLNFHPLHRTEHNPRQDPSEIESVGQMLPQVPPISINACIHQGWWKHRITESLKLEKTPKSSNIQYQSGKFFTASLGILAYSHTVPCQEMSSMKDSLNIMISETKCCRKTKPFFKNIVNQRLL